MDNSRPNPYILPAGLVPRYARDEPDRLLPSEAVRGYTPVQVARPAKPELVPSAVEEVLRFASPVQLDPRRATRDVELCGEKVRQGEMVISWLGSANRDESVFREPDRFDIGRKENRHVAFGFGTHYCLGSNLARLEAQIALRALLVHTKSFALSTTKALPLHRSLVFRSFTEIPVELVPA